MARVELSPEFSRISGKLCRTEKTVVACNKKTGKMYRYDYHERKSNKPSNDQQTVMNKFKRKAQVAAAFYNAHKPKTADATPDEIWTKLQKAYNAQNKYGNIFCYVRSLVNDQNQVEFGGKKYSGAIEADEDGLGS